ncbi:MAG TPA: DMT family transporter [Bacillota bacterium]
MNYSPYLLLILANLFFGCNIIVAKLVTKVIPPITLTFLRWLGSLLILLPFCWREIRTNWRFYLSRWPLILILGSIGYSLNTILAYESVRYSTAINVSFINAFMPIMVAVAGYVLYREPITGLQFTGFILSLTGVLWIIFQGDWMHLVRFKANTGDLFMVLNVLTWPLFPVLYKYKASDWPRLPMLAWMIFAGLLVAIPPVIIENLIFNGVWVGQVRWIHIIGILGLAIFPSILANQFQNTALKYVPVSKVSIFQSLIPVFASLIAVIFLGEKFYLYHACGGFLILVGVFLVIRPDRRTT